MAYGCNCFGAAARWLSGCNTGQPTAKKWQFRKRNLGGICLNWVAYPKGIIKSAQVYEYAKTCKDYGITLQTRQIWRR